MPSKYYPKSSSNSGPKQPASKGARVTRSRGSVPDSVMNKLDMIRKGSKAKQDKKKSSKEVVKKEEAKLKKVSATPLKKVLTPIKQDKKEEKKQQVLPKQTQPSKVVYTKIESKKTEKFCGVKRTKKHTIAMMKIDDANDK